jgi:plasmid stability protein
MYCGKVKNVTVSLDDQVYHRARVTAAERGTSLSALVRSYLEELGSGESESDRLKKSERALRAMIGEFRGGSGQSRDQLHERDA